MKEKKSSQYLWCTGGPFMEDLNVNENFFTLFMKHRCVAKQEQYKSYKIMLHKYKLYAR